MTAWGALWSYIGKREGQIELAKKIAKNYQGFVSAQERYPGISNANELFPTTDPVMVKLNVLLEMTSLARPCIENSHYKHMYRRLNESVSKLRSQIETRKMNEQTYNALLDSDVRRLIDEAQADEERMRADSSHPGENEND